MGFSAMLAEEYILIVRFAYRLYHGATSLRNINWSLFSFIFLFIFSYRAEVTQNISTAESPDTLAVSLNDILHEIEK